MIAKGWGRVSINQHVSRPRRLFRRAKARNRSATACHRRVTLARLEALGIDTNHEGTKVREARNRRAARFAAFSRLCAFVPSR